MDEMYVKLFSRTCILILLSLGPSTPMSVRKCIIKKNDETRFLICDPPEPASAIKPCCYDAEMDDHYCCPIKKLLVTSYTTRVAGSVTAAVILIICIILLCIFSSRCPLRKALLNRRSRRAEHMAAAEGTPGD